MSVAALMTDGAASLVPPVLLSVAWSFLLLLYMASGRVFALQKGVMPMHFYKAHQGAEVPEALQKVDRAYENLFEIGILFFPAVIFAILVGATGDVVQMAAWIHVLARIAQGLIHITFNNINLRFLVFGISCVAQIVIWWQVGAQVL